MALEVKISAAKFKPILDKMKKLEPAIRDTVIQKSLQQSGAFMVSSLQAGFTKSRDPKGEKWERLHFPFRPDDDGIIRPPKRPTTPDSKPLVNTGALRNDLTFQMVGGNAVIIGYGTPELQKIAYKHQFGIRGPAKIYSHGKYRLINIKPFKRPQIGFAEKFVRLGTRNDINSILTIFSDNLKRILEGTL